MSFEQKIARINELQQKIDSYGKLPDDTLRKINYKFRLEWNYTSNSMEGNLLTKSETRSVMVGNITVDGKPIKDVLEVKGHDEVINTILKVGKGSLNISEQRIKDIHKGIMHEENPEKKNNIGEWKKEKNYLYNYKNERFDFAAPADVPEKMHDLVNWINAQKDKITKKTSDAMHPVALALRFNLDYVTIHPFYDGNGRTSRILTNLILIAYGYPPIYIKEAERASYYQYLGDIQGYGGEPDVFNEYMSNLLIRSQELVLAAITGEEIDEPSDWEKSLQMLKAKNPKDGDLKKKKTVQAVRDIMNNSIFPMLDKMVNRLSQFEDVFADKHMSFRTDNSGRRVSTTNEIREAYQDEPDKFSNVISFEYTLDGYKFNGKELFHCKVYMQWQFDEFMYYTWVNENDPGKEVKHFYHEYYSENEIEKYINKCGDILMKQIADKLKKTDTE